jgi:hypothetical protein
VVIIKTLEDSDIAFSYTISPETYTGYEGTWYCSGKRPLRPVFEVLQPRMQVRWWDLEKDEDVTGKTIPVTANITYRLDTNLDRALQLKYRPDVTSQDSFYTIDLRDPAGKVLSSVYTGTYGRADSHGLIFDHKPMITTSPYYWRDGSAWDKTSKNIQGDLIYPPGTYSISISQNLNHIRESYAEIAEDKKAGVLDTSATVTFYKPASTPAPTTAVPGTPQETLSPVSTTPSPVVTVIATTETVPPTHTAIPKSTTYASLPSWIAIAALGMALACAAWLKR